MASQQNDNPWISTNEAAKILGVSGATVRNWCRAGYLAPASTRPLVFTYTDVYLLKDKILNNRFNRLRKRANKTASDDHSGLDVSDAQISGDIQQFLEALTADGTPPGLAVFTAAAYYLRKKGEADFPQEDGTLDFDSIVWKRTAVRNIMAGWLRRNDGEIARAPLDVIQAFTAWKDHGDNLGLLYQGLSSTGRKAKAGAYFTPGHIIDECLAELGDRAESFLDPCCGTGRYLTRAAQRFDLDLDRIHGFDTDPVAVDIARLNLLLHYRDADTIPGVFCCDSLNDLANGLSNCGTNHLLESVDAIATNPPWGGCKNQKRHKNLVALIRSGESFSLFLEKALTLLRPGGRLSFLLPEAMLLIKAHTDIRRLILEQATIEKISLLGKVFSGVFTPIIRLTLCKRRAPEDWMVRVIAGGKAHTKAQRRFAANVNHSFDVAVTPHDEGLLDKIFAVPHVTLAGQADWALGIVTGDNSRCVLETRVSGSEAVLRGRDVFKYAAREPRCFIKFKPERFQQVAPERIYRAPEKLIYRFISDRLVFAYDDRGTLTLNSANIVIPRIPGIPIKVAMAFLNSRIFQYVYTKRINTRKVLKSDLEIMPFPHLDAETLAKIERQVEMCMGGEYGPADELNRIIYSVFGLTEEEIAALEAGLAAESKRLLI